MNVTRVQIDKLLGQTRTVKVRKPRRRGTSGRGLEALIANSQQGVTLTQFRQEAVRVRGNKLIARRGPCDFAGAVVGTGQAIALDAKEGALPHRLDTSESHLPQHQVDHLVRIGRAGGVAGVLALSLRRNAVFWLPWSLLLIRQPSHQWDELVEVGPATGAIDWQRVIRAESSVTP